MGRREKSLTGEEPKSSMIITADSSPNIPIPELAEDRNPVVLNCVPPVSFERNSYGLLNSVDYIFNPDGTINWRKMIRADCLVPDKQKTQETDLSKIGDEDLLILLLGLKDLAMIRGFKSVDYEPLLISPTYCSILCRIVWISNYETGHKEVSFSSIGEASEATTNSFASDYLSSIAENRAFARCVRNFLRIRICSKEEVSDKVSQKAIEKEVSNNPNKKILLDLMEEQKIDIETIKDFLKELGFEKWHEVTSVKDIPMVNVFELIGKLKT